MKKLIAAAVILCVGFSLFAIDISAYVPIDDNVKSYTVTDYIISSKFGESFRTPEAKFKHVFDKFGSEIEVTEFSTRDVIIQKITNSYDADGQLESKVATDADSSVIWKNTITYKNNLRADVSEMNANNQLKSKIIYTYDDDDLLVDETAYNGDGALVWKIIYEYNDDGDIVRENHYFSDGQLYEAKEYSYSENRALVSISTFGPIGNLRWREILRYDANGVITEVTTVDRDDKTTARKILRYDSRGNLLRVTDYNVSKKFGTTVNELVDMLEYEYTY